MYITKEIYKLIVLIYICGITKHVSAVIYSHFYRVLHVQRT